jgi:hypothetical protein
MAMYRISGQQLALAKAANRNWRRSSGKMNQRQARENHRAAKYQ